MIIKEDYLIKLNNKSRIQVVHTILDNENSIFVLKRIVGQFNGKQTNHPEITISSGKAARTVTEQATLVYNSHLKEYLDKGYKLLSKLTTVPFNSLTEDDLKKMLNTFTTDQNGVPKPMLAKLADQCATSIFENNWYCSYKLDGTRMMLYYKDGEIKSASRGGNNYDASTTHIRTNPKVIEFFQNHPDIILDGELYKHDAAYPLQRISGLVRQKEWKDECSVLEYWVYDYVSNEPFKERWEHLQEWEELFTNTPIKILEHKLLSGYLIIKKEHDKAVQEGFEGLCMRNPDKEYGVDKRSAKYLVKLKDRKDDEATIIDIKEGLRPEDMCFILKMPNGKTFAAKPIGDVATRLNYLNNKNQFIGQLGTYTYFNLSSDGTPTQPVFKAVRYQDDL